MGFPMECFLPQEYNFAGPDPKLDMVVALLAMGKNDYRGIVYWGFPWSASFPRMDLIPVHPQNVRFRNVRFQNVRFLNIRFTKRQVYKTSGFKTSGFNTSGFKI